MVKKKKKCKVDYCNNYSIWSQGLCKFHYQQENPPKAIKKITEKQKEKNKAKAIRTKELHSWFLLVWDKRADENGDCRCFETGTLMKGSIYRENTCVYSHCYAKADYPEFAMEDWNLLIVLPDIHSLWGSNMDKTPKMKAYFNEIKEKYGK